MAAAAASPPRLPPVAGGGRAAVLLGRRRRSAALACILALLAGAAAEHKGEDEAKDEGGKGNCSREFKVPSGVPLQALDYNGVQLEDVCLGDGRHFHHVYVIGDWGGIVYGPNMPPIPADKRSKLFPSFHRDFVTGVDDRAQLRVAAEMRRRALHHPPDYVLNVGDNFYWGGVSAKCGLAPFQSSHTGQWLNIFENVYWGSGLDGKVWLGVLGNHDYGGYHFTSAWDQVIGYSWDSSTGSTGRWMTPAQYYGQKVNYPDFCVEYLFVDTNVFEAWSPEMNPSHNICGLQHNGPDASCGPQGPRSVDECQAWFTDLWEQQMQWLEHRLSVSTANWQVIVTHLPPKWGSNDWNCLAARYGIDLFISGHIHHQRIYAPGDSENFLGNTAVIVSGGGGGITSEGPPDLYGDDDAYGFVHLTLTKNLIKIDAISHGGVVRSSTHVQPRWPVAQPGTCMPPVSAAHFEPVNGGRGHGCRGDGDARMDGAEYMLLERVPSLEACQRHCRNTPSCKGIEFGNQLCQLWTAEIKHTVPVEGAVCMRVLPGWDAQTQLADEKHKKERHHKHENHTFGGNRSCRGGDASDLSPAYFVLHKSTPSLPGCERLCLSSPTCKGIEYGPGTDCKVWTREIEASVPKDGVVCLPRGSKRHSLQLPEIPPEQLHI